MTDLTLKNILERAIQSEEHSYSLYSHLATKVERPEVRKLLEGLAEQELRHKEMLESFEVGGNESIEGADIKDQKLTDFMEPAPVDPSATVQDVMLFAIKKEQSAYEFYQRMGEFAPRDDIKGLFDKLAGEEIGHKHSLESVYEEMFMREN
jgi:rubrerythrin